jgi:sugar lactone lactonase YvrE
MLHRRVLAVCAAAAAFAAITAAQTPSPTPTPTPTATPTSGTPTPTPTPGQAPYTTPTGQSWTTTNSVSVTGTRMARQNGATWFLTPSNDQIVKFDGTVMTEWPIRDTDNIGANPVDFVLEGDVMWFIENGESLIDAGQSIVARLDTSSGALQEYVFPTSQPSGFYRAPDGKIWVAQSAGVLESLDTSTFEVFDYRVSPPFFAGNQAIGPDGGLWISDFANNRLIRFDFTDSSMKAWTLFDPSQFILNIADMKFDSDGFLWMVELSGNRMDRFDIHTGEFRSYLGFNRPIHLDFYGGNIYVTQQTGGNGLLSIVDPRVAPYTVQTITPVDLVVAPPLARPNGSLRTSVITPVTFTPTNAQFASSDLVVTLSVPGILFVQWASPNAYGLVVDGGAFWAGSDGFLVNIVPQTLGGPTDQTIPIALQIGSPPADAVGVDLTLYNKGSTTISGTAFLQYSAGAFPYSRTFDVPAGGTTVLHDAFVGAATGTALSLGSVRIQVTSGTATDLAASARSARGVANNGTYGLTLPAQAASEILGVGASRVLFTGARPTDVSTFGFFSPTGGTATAELIGADGTSRATATIHVVSNVLEAHNPAASFFGLAAEPGDLVRVTVTDGVLQPWILIQDSITRDVAISLPVSPTADAVIPNVSSIPIGSRLWTSGLQAFNPAPGSAATVQATYYPIGGSPLTASFSLAPLGSASYGDMVTELFEAPPGQGAVVLTSNVPVAISFRNTARNLDDGSEYACQSPALDGAASVGAAGATAIGVEWTATRRTHLLLFNRGSAGTVTIHGIDASGASVGTLSVPVGANAAARVNSVLDALGAPDTTSVGAIRVEASPGMRLYAQTVNVDGVTGDTDLVALR